MLRDSPTILLSVLAVFLLDRTTVAAEPESHETATAQAPANGPIRLFDGKSLAGCYTWLKDSKYEDPRKVFRVTGGMLHVTGDGLGGLVTKTAYRDYHLVLEYRWGEKTWHDRTMAARDSGLLIHSNGVDGGYHGIWMPSIEVQIIEGGVGDFILVTGNDAAGKPVPLSVTCHVGRDRDDEVVWQPDGEAETFHSANAKRINWFGRDPDWEDTKGFRGSRDVDSPDGKWTRLDVITAGPRITTFVNGVKVNEAFQVSPQAGRIQLQSEFAEIYFRRWELWPADAGPQPEPAVNE